MQMDQLKRTPKLQSKQKSQSMATILIKNTAGVQNYYFEERP